MKIKKSKLLEILEALRPGLSGDDIIDNSDSICFMDDKIFTYNDRVWVLYPLDTGLEGSVKEDRLYKHLRKAGADKEGNIGLKQIDSDLIISSGKKGKTRAGIPFIDVVSDSQFSDDQNWKKLPKGFSEGMVRASTYATSNFNRPLLTCVNVNGKMIEASDGQRGFRTYLSKKIKKQFLVPAEAVNALKGKTYIKYALDYEINWAFFKTKEGLITGLRMPGETNYPDMDFLFEIDSKKEFTFPKDLNKTIDQAIDFIGEDEETAYLHLKFDGKKILVTSRSTHGWFKEPVKFKSKIKMSFFINPLFLKEIFRSTFTATLNDSRGLLLFKSDDWEHVINISMD